jgi:uncharacterized protein YozE (UPF0346 family)
LVIALRWSRSSPVPPSAQDADDMSKFNTFYEWLAKQKNQSTPLGRLATDALRDVTFPKDVASLEALLEYFKSKQAPGVKVATARVAWQTYARVHSQK